MKAVDMMPTEMYKDLFGLWNNNQDKMPLPYIFSHLLNGYALTNPDLFPSV